MPEDSEIETVYPWLPIWICMGPAAEYYGRAMSLIQVTKKMNTETEVYVMSKSQ